MSFFLSLVLLAVGAPVSQRVTSSAVKLGEPFSYEITLPPSSGGVPSLQPIQDWGSFGLLEQHQTQSIFSFKLQLFELGKKKLPELTFSVAGKPIITVPGIDVEGLGRGEAKMPASFEDIKPVKGVSVRTYRVLWGVLLMAAAAAGVYAFIRWRNRPKAQPSIVPPPPLDPAVRARQRLNNLEAENLPQQGRYQEFFFQLSEIVRSYWGEVFFFDALECTSAELMEALRRRPTGSLSIEQVEKFIDASDLVKFARAQSTPAECHAAFQAAASFIVSSPAGHDV